MKRGEGKDSESGGDEGTRFSRGLSVGMEIIEGKAENREFIEDIANFKGPIWNFNDLLNPKG